MDAQSSLATIAGLAGLIHGLARAAAEETVTGSRWSPREALMESSFRAARDGMGATLLFDGALTPVAEIARAAMARARPFARELGSDGALELLDGVIAGGAGADRQRAAYARGGMPAVLEHLAAETATEFSYR
jgi:carboxylate-amine ligase